MRLVKPYQVSSQTGPPKAAFGTMPFVLALFFHREPPSSASLTLVTILSPHVPPLTFHAPRSSRSAVVAARRAGYSTSHPAEGQHATKCYVFRFFRKFGEPCFRRKSI